MITGVFQKISWKFRISTIYNFAVIYPWNLRFFLKSSLLFKGATKSYLTRYFCVVIAFFNTALCRSAFSKVYFRKLVFRLSALSLNQDIKKTSSCYVILICNFVLTLYKNSPFINNKLFIKILQYYVKVFF